MILAACCFDKKVQNNPNLLIDSGKNFMAYSDEIQQKICIYCKRIISLDGSWKEYKECSAKSSSLDMKSTICPNCSFEKYPKFYGIHHAPNRVDLKKKKWISKVLSSFKRMVLYRSN